MWFFHEKIVYQDKFSSITDPSDAASCKSDFVSLDVAEFTTHVQLNSRIPIVPTKDVESSIPLCIMQVY